VTFKSSYGRPDLTAPRWNGEITLDGTLYLHGEQGAGDILMMARYIPLIASGVGAWSRGTRAARHCSRRASPAYRSWRAGQSRRRTTCHLPMMSLPMVFGTTLVECASAGAVFGRNGIDPVEAGRIGVCWKGSATHANDRTRSMPLEAMQPLFSLPGFTWASLQYGEHVDGLEDLPKAITSRRRARSRAASS
jgi:hypothetical protein